MRNIQRVGPYIEVVEARSPENPTIHIKVGIRQDTFQQLVHHYFSTAVAQFYGLVQPGLVPAVHAFRGVKRPLLHAGNLNADSGVIVYSWRPEFDYVWVGNRSEGHPAEKTPAPNRVLVVLLREFPVDEFGCRGSIEHWNWVAEDPYLPQAPVNWAERYSKRLWSRSL